MNIAKITNVDDETVIHRLRRRASRHSRRGHAGRMEQWQQVAARQHGVVRRDTPGLSRHRSRREVKIGGFVPHGRHTLLVGPAADTPERRLWAAVAEVGSPCAVSGAAALWLYGVPVPELPERPEILIPRHRWPRSVDGARVQRVVVREMARARTSRGLPVASVPVAVRRSSVELSAHALAAVVEHVLRMRLTTREQLRRALGHGLVGAARLRSALEVTSPESHSFWERRLATLIRDAGLPRPQR